MGAGRIRFNRGPSLMKHRSTNRLSASMFSSFCVALATADLTTFSISRVALGLFVNFNVISASFTFLPRIKSIVSRAFCGDKRINLLVALLTMINSLSVLEQEPHRRPLRPALRLRLASADPPAQRLCLWSRLHYVL